MLNQSRRALAGALLAVTAALAACSSSGSGAAGKSTSPPTSPSVAAFPVTVHTAGGSVTISHRPSAIVSLSPTGTEMLFAIGAGTQVKAVDKNSNYPASAPHTGINAYQLNVEALATYQPDLVVTSGLSTAQQTKIKSLGVPVLDLPAATTLNQSYQEIAELGQASGHTAAASKEVASMKRQIAAIVKGAPKRHATYYWELDQTYYSETSTTFIGQALRLLGLTSIADSAKGAAASGGYPQLSAEFILKANPDYVFLADTKCCKQTPSTVAHRPGWSSLTAVHDERVIPLDDDIASRWGPRIVDLLRTVANAVRQHPANAR